MHCAPEPHTNPSHSIRFRIISPFRSSLNEINEITRYKLTRNALVVLPLDESDHASAPSSVFVRLAVSVRPAGYVVARVHASAVHACEQIVAVVVRAALVLGHGSGAPAPVRVAHRAPRAFADVVAFRVDAVGAVPAGVVRALVHVHATVLGIPLVAGLAHASRWIARRALGVYAAWKPVARI